MYLRTLCCSAAAASLFVSTASAQESAPSTPPAPADQQTVPLPALQVESTAKPKTTKKKAAKKSSAPQAAAANQPQSSGQTSSTPSESGLKSPPGSFVAKTSLAGTKTDTPLIEVPQSISVVTREQLDTRDVKTVVEALQYVPGVAVHTSGKDPRFDSFQMRGFDQQGFGTFRDGLKELGSADAFNHFRNEPYGMERIDVLRGPPSVLYGQASPGGIIDIISKRPTEETLREVVGTIGSDELFQGAFDLSGKVNQDGTLLFRLVGLARESDAQVAHFSDFVDDDRLFLAPSFTFKPDSDTTLTVLTDFQHDKTGNAFAASRFYPNYPNSATSEPTKIFTGDPNYDKFEQDQFRVGYQFEHRFNDTFTARQNLRYGEIDLDYRYLLGGIAPALGGPNVEYRVPRAIDEHTRTFAVDNQLQAKLVTGPVKHTVVTGLDYQHFWLDEVSYASNAPLFLILANPVYGLNIPKPTAVSGSIDQETTQIGIYAQDQAKFGNWVLTFGGRYDWAEVDTLDRLEDDPNVARTVKKDEAFTGRVGLTYLLDFGLAPYVSYSESFLPTTSTDYEHKPFDPTTGQQYEAGLKYEWGNELKATLAVFDITQQNVLSLDSLHSGTAYWCGTSCMTQTGEVRSRGFEAEVVATLAEGLNLTASYTIMDIEVTKSVDDTELGNVPFLTPEQMASIYADYTIPGGVLKGFGFGFGARYIGESYKDKANLYVNDAYTVYDGGLHYTFDNTTLRLNVSNLFDKDEATCSAAGGCQWISPRIVTGSVRYRW